MFPENLCQISNKLHSSIVDVSLFCSLLLHVCVIVQSLLHVCVCACACTSPCSWRDITVSINLVRCEVTRMYAPEAPPPGISKSAAFSLFFLPRTTSLTLRGGGQKENTESMREAQLPARVLWRQTIHSFHRSENTDKDLGSSQRGR